MPFIHNTKTIFYGKKVLDEYEVKINKHNYKKYDFILNQQFNYKLFYW